MIDWNKIEIVLLDMDGTLLDLHFDNHFWREHVMHVYAETHQVPLDETRTRLLKRMDELRGTLDWYCLDFWSKELELDVLALKRDVKHLIKTHTHAEAFLQALYKWRSMILVTDAHPDVLKIKLNETGIGIYFDKIISSHEFKQPKESQLFWQHLQREIHFNPATTILIEDSQRVLRAARQFGIGHLLAISRPDSHEKENSFTDIPSIRDFSEVLPLKT